jgi:type I site-specific restriction endonuclease
VRALGWKIVRHTDGLDLASLEKAAVAELPTASGPADYGLFVRGQLLGIIEAKKVTVTPQNVLVQAKPYAAGAYNGVGKWDGLRVLSCMRVTANSFGTWMPELKSAFLARLEAFIHRKR